MTDRIAELEMALAHQARMVEELSGELARAFTQIERHEKALKELAERFLALEDLSLIHI